MKATLLVKKLMDLIPVLGNFDVNPDILGKMVEGNSITVKSSVPKRNPKVLFGIPRGEILDAEEMLKILKDAGIIESSPDEEQWETVLAFHILSGEGK